MTITKYHGRHNECARCGDKAGPIRSLIMTTVTHTTTTFLCLACLAFAREVWAALTKGKDISWEDTKP
jgi:hypothetical protein